MQRLTTKHRFAIIFSVYVFLFLAILASIFIVLFNITSDRQLKRDLYLESIDVINNHLFLDNNTLTFKKDQSGASLREQLITHSTAAVFLDVNKQVLRTYGIFAVGNGQEGNIDFNQLANKALQTTKPVKSNLQWRDQSLISLTTPLKNKGKIVGFLILGKSLEEYSLLKQMMLTIFIVLGTLGLVSSFAIGYLLALRAFRPLNKMTRIIEGLELDKLDAELTIEGHSEDEIVRLGRKFNQMISRLHDMANRQKAFIANASHELKTPLTRAISSLELLSLTQIKNEQSSSSSKKDIGLVRDDLFQINTLLEKLLLLTKQKKDINTWKSYKLNTEELISVLRRRFEGQWRAKGLKFFVKVVSEIYITIPREYLQMVISNLLSNSTKYSKPYKNLFLNISKIKNQIVISVSDEGIGMSEEEVKHIFDRFYRKDKEMQNEGYGIGLSVVKQICDLYSISIKVISKTEEGTTISLFFPLAH